MSVHGLGQRAWLRAATGEGTRLKWSLRGKGAGSDGVSGMNTEQGERLRTRLSAEDRALSRRKEGEKGGHMSRKMSK